MEDRYISYFLQQSGRGLADIGDMYRAKKVYQRGFNYYTPHPPITIQHGNGIGSFFQNLYRIITPLLHSGINALKSEATNASRNILKDIATKPITELITTHGAEAINNLTNRASEQFKEMRGRGIGRKRAIKNKESEFGPQSFDTPFDYQVKKRSSKSCKDKKARVLDIFDQE
jgi:hypothetical protein